MLLFAFLHAGCSSAQPRYERPLLYGYHVWWMGEAWNAPEYNVLDGIFTFEIRVNADGEFETVNGFPEQWDALGRSLRNRGALYAPTFAMFEAQAFDALFTSVLARDNLVRNIERIVTASIANGVHIDFELYEPVSREAREGFSRFVETLRERMPNHHLSLFLPSFDLDDNFDEGRIAAASDHLIVQGYDLFWATGPTAGPTAPVAGWTGNDWRAIVDRYVREGVPRSKIIMSIPFYGYEWPTVSDVPGAATRGPGRAITLAPIPENILPDVRINAQDRVRTYGLRRDPGSSSPYYVYRTEEGWFQGWFDDATSFARKKQFVQEERLGGMAIFPLGYERGLGIVNSLR